MELPGKAPSVVDLRPQRHPHDFGNVLRRRHFLQALWRVFPSLSGLYAVAVCWPVALRIGGRESSDETGCGCY